MATEVTCGQCQGRLLVETLGVIVACPHCGVHLSIPAPEPAPTLEPVPAPSPPAESVMSPAPSPAMESSASEPATNVSPEIAPAALADFASNVSAAASATVQSPPPANIPRSDSNSPNVHEGPEAAANPAEFGWHSAPNLYLASQDQPARGSTAPEVNPPPTFHAPASSPVSHVAATTEPVATFPSFGEPTPPNPPPPVVTTTAPATAETTQEKTLFFSASQQFSLGPAAVEPPTQPTPTTFVFTAPTPKPTNEPKPPSPTPAATQPTLQFTAAAPAPTAPPQTSAAFSGFASTVASSPPSARGPLPSTTVAEEAKSFEDNATASQLKFITLLLIVVGSYASAVTIVLLYMFLFGGTSALESLPDLKPPKTKNGDISWQYNPPQNEVAPRHVLSLGQSRRFGSVLVTPVKVTRGVAKFEHYSGKTQEEGFGRGPTGSLLKLWLKFENVSRDQTFAPLDPLLLYTRDVKNLGEFVRANSFVATEANRRKGKSLFFTFEMPIHSEFRMVGQNLDKELAPGETVTSFVPSDEEASNLKGDLVWRIQFRKGYNRTSYRGVTTLIDVRFNSSDIVADGEAT
jgi:hypothetical protein